MSILHLVKCEVCDKTAQGVTPPDGWYTLSKGDETWHFHDEACLAIWRLTMLSVMPAQQPQDKPACTARRFLLIDEAANITEGVTWGDGHVTLDSSSQHCNGDFHCQGYFHDWDTFKAAHPGSGVQWIDQEVAE